MTSMNKLELKAYKERLLALRARLRGDVIQIRPMELVEQRFWRKGIFPRLIPAPAA